MRISDWSSDVCSSDLAIGRPQVGARVAAVRHAQRRRDLLVIIGDDAAFGGQLVGALGQPQPVADVKGRIDRAVEFGKGARGRSEEHTSELQSLMRISYAVFCLQKKTHMMTRPEETPYNINRL